MRYQDIFNEKYLNHLCDYDHFDNAKPECKYGNKCYAYKRLSEGGNELKDRCHVQIFRHPPRFRKSDPSDDLHSFVLNDEFAENVPLYRPSIDDQKQYKYNEQDGYLKALITEVIDNGFENDLYLNAYDDISDHNYSI
eukprot:461592_1